MKLPRVADYITSRLSEKGMSDVFLVTGGGAMHLNDAFGRNPQFKVTCCHHEQACAMAAESYYRSSNKPAVLNVTTGPGGINAMNGVWGAFVDSCSMFVVSGQVKLSTYSGYYELPMRQLGDQEVNIVELVKPITKFAITVENAEDIRWIMDKALYVMSLGRPGPVWIDVPIDISSQTIDPSALQGWSVDHTELIRNSSIHPTVKYDLENYSFIRTQRVELNDPELYIDSTVYADHLSMYCNVLLQDIKKAKRPVLFAGNGIRFSGQTEAFLELAVRLGVPIVSGWNAHDIIPTSHPCYAGRPGTVGDRAGNFTVQNADLLIVFGSRLNIRQISYNYKNFAKNAHIHIIDIDRSELDKPTFNDLGIGMKIHEDLKVLMPSLLQHTEKWEPKIEHHGWLGWCREKVDRYPVVLPEYQHGESFLNPYKFIHEFSKDWEENDIIVTGNGSACVIPFQCAEIKPNQRLYTNSGDASMGYDLPAAIGAAIANPDKRIICLAGDGSIMMNLQELQTIQTLDLNIKLIVLNNNGYLSIKQTQKNYFSDNEFGTEDGNGVGFPDFAKVGESFEIPSETVRTMNDWSNVQDMFSRASPCLIDVHLDPNQIFSPKLAAKKLEDGSMLAPSLENMSPFLSDEEMKQNVIDDNHA